MGFSYTVTHEDAINYIWVNRIAVSDREEIDGIQRWLQRQVSDGKIDPRYFVIIGQIADNDTSGHD